MPLGMNKQLKTKNGVVVGRGIEWTDYTWNPLGGCLHDCEWVMPSGEVAECYAKTVAERLATAAYPAGFRAHYYHPERLESPLKLTAPSRIFPDSMADLMGAWVPAEQIAAVFDVMRRAHWHSFQLLTKNAPRYRKIANMIPANVWCGASTPPDHMFGRALTRDQQIAMLRTTLEVFTELPKHLIKWLSVEPLSWDVSDIIAEALQKNDKAVNWLVIGAATNGNTVYAPNQEHLDKLLSVADTYGTGVFFKGNLDRNMVDRWREDFPATAPWDAQKAMVLA